jgi:lipopolysaccharide biosynthesis protein
VFDMPRYIQQIEVLALEARERMDEERKDVGDLANSSLPRMDFVTPGHESGMSRDRALRHYARTWAVGLYRRKPFPGFHPGVYLEGMVTTDRPGDPLAHYLRGGEPDGPWCYEVIEPASDVGVIRIDARIALHVHVYYPALLPEIVERLNINVTKPDLLISVPSRQVGQEVRAMLDDYAGRVVEIREVPNRGRDIGPFLTAFGATLMRGYEIVGHLHTKKSVDVSDVRVGDRWRRFLLEHLLGGADPMADIILSRMFADPTIGIVVPDDPNVIGWDDNKSYAESLMDRLALETLPEQFLFPVGTMFWARVDALRPIFELGLDWNDYPAEPLPYDGSLLHALERLFGVVANRKPYRAVTTSVPGSAR